MLWAAPAEGEVLSNIFIQNLPEHSGTLIKPATLPLCAWNLHRTRQDIKSIGSPGLEEFAARSGTLTYALGAQHSTNPK